MIPVSVSLFLRPPPTLPSTLFVHTPLPRWLFHQLAERRWPSTVRCLLRQIPASPLFKLPSSSDSPREYHCPRPFDPGQPLSGILLCVFHTLHGPHSQRHIPVIADRFPFVLSIITFAVLGTMCVSCLSPSLPAHNPNRHPGRFSTLSRTTPTPDALSLRLECSRY
jgi:hypothetical protein